MSAEVTVTRSSIKKLLLVTVTSADTDTQTYNSNLEFGLRCLTVTHAKPLDSNMNVEIAIPSLFNTIKINRVKMVLKHNWAAPSSTRYTWLQLNYYAILKSHSTTQTVG